MKHTLLFCLLLPVCASALRASDAVRLHYARRDGDQRGWNMWVWNETEKKPGFELAPSSSDSFGAVYELDLSSFALSGASVGFLPRMGDWADKDAPDRILKSARGGDFYLLQEDPQVYSSRPEISLELSGAWLDGGGTVRIAFNRSVDTAFLGSQDFRLSGGRRVLRPSSARLQGGGGTAVSALLTFDGLESPGGAAPGEEDWELLSLSFAPEKLRLGAAVYGPGFFSDLPLGAVTEDGSTVIRVFAPKARKTEVLLYESPDAAPSARPMARKAGGIWELKAGARLDGKYYRIRTEQDGKTYEGVDPYAGCAAADSGPALIHTDRTPVAPSPAFGLSEAVIYEVHLRDLTMDPFSGAKRPGKYLGAAETGTRHTRYPEILTGLDHIAELGANTVHILPFQDFENGDSTTSYNWGYMPVNFNSPEGSYASSADPLSRVRDVKAMISAFHRKGLKVIMDVVYNHTAETRSRVYNFNALSMDYYYRVNPDGSYSNGSGCGNEFKSESPMGRRFILDSLLHWVREYGVDGFRFDLMGLIDLDTVDALVGALKAEKPDIIVYGEPWSAGRTPVDGVRKGSQRSKGFSVFNDGLRDALKGSVFDLRDQGYVQAAKNREAVMKGMRGSVDDFTDGPLESLNYVSCHDNHTLWDRIDLSTPDAGFAEKVKMDKLANAVVLTSQGVPFLHAGAEFLRTKKGEENSYNLPDEINRLDWTRKRTYMDVFGYYRDLIAMRREHPAFRMRTAAEVRGNMKFYEELGLAVESPAIAYVLYGDAVGDAWSRIAVLVNPLRTPLRFALPDGEWRTAFDGEGRREGPGTAERGAFEAAPLSLSVLYQAIRR